MQELAARVDELDKIVASLQGTIEDLQERVERIEREAGKDPTQSSR